MVAHDEISSVGNLIGQVYIGIAQGVFLQIGFVQRFAVDCDIAVLINVHPVTGGCDQTLDQDFIIIVKRDNIAVPQFCALHGHHNFPLVQGWRHGGTIDLQYRQQERCDQNSDGCHNDQCEDRTAQHGTITLFVAFPLQLRL